MCTIDKPQQCAALSLAYVGDAVYELYVRNRIIAEHPDMPAHKLHKKAIGYVKAHAQSNSIMFLEDKLSEEEMSVYKRGRNAKSPTVPKNADLTDYRRATGFETLVGYLYLEKNEERLNEIMKQAYESADKEQLIK